MNVTKKRRLVMGIAFVTSLVAFTLLFRFVLFITIIPTSSMSPTLPTNTIAFFLRPTREIQPGDIVLLWSDEEELLLVKRVIGIGGDEVHIEDHGVVRNGEILEEPYTQGDTQSDKNEYEVPENTYLLMGDNREDSKDSRAWENPYIDENDIRGILLGSIS